MILPITVAGLTRDIRVAIMPHLDADYYLGVNFVRAFRAVLDPDTDRLFCKDADAYVELEVASLTTEPSTVAAIGLADAMDLQREELKALVESIRLCPSTRVDVFCSALLSSSIPRVPDRWSVDWTVG